MTWKSTAIILFPTIVASAVMHITISWNLHHDGAWLDYLEVHEEPIIVSMIISSALVWVITNLGKDMLEKILAGFQPPIIGVIYTIVAYDIPTELKIAMAIVITVPLMGMTKLKMKDIREIEKSTEKNQEREKHHQVSSEEINKGITPMKPHPQTPSTKDTGDKITTLVSLLTFATPLYLITNVGERECNRVRPVQLQYPDPSWSVDRGRTHLRNLKDIQRTEETSENQRPGMPDQGTPNNSFQRNGRRNSATNHLHDNNRSAQGRSLQRRHTR